MKKISDKLREIAGWIDEGRVIQFTDPNFKGEWSAWKDSINCPYDDGIFRVNPKLEYRAKPIKPAVRIWEADGLCRKFVQLTEEVREALKQAGIDYD